MEDKIEVGEYVRTNCEIYKIVEFMKNENGKVIGAYDEIGFYRNFTLFHIVKHSKNIIDLIEVGDYVNGKQVKHIAMFEGFPDYPKLIFVDEYRLLPDETCENKDIKSIVTKEQFEQVKYKVGE